MDNQNVKSDSEDEIKNRKTTKRLSKEWYCDICNNGKNYTMAGKSRHLKTKRHKKNEDPDVMLDKMIRKESLKLLVKDILML